MSKFLLSRRGAGSLALLLCLGSCGTLPNGRRWGQDATLLPGRARLGRALKRAVVDPLTWVPAGLGAVLAAGDLDRDISRWARRETPLYGKPRRAADRSDDFSAILYGASIVTAVLTPSGEGAGAWAGSKAKGLAVVLAADELAGMATSNLKDVSNRRRPNDRDDRSFPSGHSTGAFASANLAAQHLRSIEMGSGWRKAGTAGLYTLATGTAWARVEAGEHFPSDVFFGAAIGNLVTDFIYDAFLGLDSHDGPDLGVGVGSGDELLLSLGWSW